MAYLSREQVKNIIDNAPAGTKPADIVSTLQARGHTLEGLDLAPVAATPKKNLLQKAEGVANVLSFGVGKKTGEAIGTLAGYITSPNKQFYDTSAPTPLQVGGDILAGAAAVTGLKAPLAKTVLGKAGQVAGLSGATALGTGLAKKQPIEDIAKSTARSAAIGFGIGGAFGLLGKGVSALAKKAGPSTLSFTSGVPKEAIKQATAAPQSYKVGLKKDVATIRLEAVDALKNPRDGLYRKLSDEFSDGLEFLQKNKLPDTRMTKAITSQQGSLPLKVNKVLNKFRLNVKQGEVLFNRSSIINQAEQRNIQDAVNTVNSWNDYSPKGIQVLAERIGELRKFDTLKGTKESAMLGEIYNKIAGKGGVIESVYPDLYGLRQNFAKNTRVLNEISEIVGTKAKGPIGMQSAITRLSNLFREDRETYLNAIRELSKRSGVDIIGELAGTEFQRVLPDFIRGLGGGGALSVGVALLNPWLALLAPLFSPRAIGTLTANSSAVAKTSSLLTRAVSSATAGRVPSTTKQGE